MGRGARPEPEALERCTRRFAGGEPMSSREIPPGLRNADGSEASILVYPDDEALYAEDREALREIAQRLGRWSELSLDDKRETAAGLNERTAATRADALAF